MKSSLLLLGAFAARVLAAPALHDYTVHERRDVLPTSWSEGKRLDRSATLPMRIGLTQSNLDRGHDLLMELYEFCRNSLFSAGYGLAEQLLAPTPARRAMESITPPRRSTISSLRRRTAWTVSATGWSRWVSRVIAFRNR